LNARSRASARSLAARVALHFEHPLGAQDNFNLVARL
jgi:hypothetical protein